MKSEPPFGLIGAGGLRRSYLTELPSLQAQLGPIKAATFSVARKYAKSLRAGYPVQPYRALELCPVIWVAVPHARLQETLAQLGRSLSVAGTEIVICSAEADSLSLQNLLRDARIATVNALDPRDLSLGYVAEGHAAPLKRLRRWFPRDGHRLLEVHPGAKPYLQAGRNLAGPILRSVATSALECMRSAGLKPRDAAELVQHFGIAGLEAASHAASSAATLESLKQSVQGIAIPLDGRPPRLETFYHDARALAIRYYAEAGVSGPKEPRPPVRESGEGSEAHEHAKVAAQGKSR